MGPALFPDLQELLVLLPHVALELQFVGDDLPLESDQQHFTLQRVSMDGAALRPSLPGWSHEGFWLPVPTLSCLLHLPVLLTSGGFLTTFLSL